MKVKYGVTFLGGDAGREGPRACTRSRRVWFGNGERKRKKVVFVNERKGGNGSGGTVGIGRSLGVAQLRLRLRGCGGLKIIFKICGRVVMVMVMVLDERDMMYRVLESLDKMFDLPLRFFGTGR